MLHPLRVPRVRHAGVPPRHADPADAPLEAHRVPPQLVALDVRVRDDDAEHALPLAVDGVGGGELPSPLARPAVHGCEVHRHGVEAAARGVHVDVDGGEAVELPRRRALRRLVAALARRARQRAGGIELVFVHLRDDARRQRRVLHARGIRHGLVVRGERLGERERQRRQRGHRRGRCGRRPAEDESRGAALAAARGARALGALGARHRREHRSQEEHAAPREPHRVNPRKPAPCEQLRMRRSDSSGKETSVSEPCVSDQLE